MTQEINRIKWKSRRGMRELDLLFRPIITNDIADFNEKDLMLFDTLQMETHLPLTLDLSCLFMGLHYVSTFLFHSLNEDCKSSGSGSFIPFIFFQLEYNA